jgi:hypothetical protein
MTGRTMALGCSARPVFCELSYGCHGGPLITSRRVGLVPSILPAVAAHSEAAGDPRWAMVRPTKANRANNGVLLWHREVHSTEAAEVIPPVPSPTV